MRSLLLALSLLPAVALGQDRASPGATAARPNIVLILADDLGYGDVRALNPGSAIPTPHFDRLAADGMVFTDAHSGSAVCTPTRYGLLTGRYAWRTRLRSGVLNGYSPPLIDVDRPTVADLLGAAGYATGMVGKWHLGMELPRRDGDRPSPWKGDPGIDFGQPIAVGPLDYGFDSFFGVSASLDMPPYLFVADRGFTAEPSAQQTAGRFPDFVRAGPRAADFEIATALDRLLGEATGFIDEHAGGDRPFFLYFALTAPHKPTTPAPRFRGETGLGPYGDFVTQVDWTVGQVLDALDSAGVADRTLVVVSSDNGSYMYRYDDEERADHVDDAEVQGYRPEHHRANAGWRGTKADVYEGGHRVPFFVRWPGTVAAGSRCSTTICLVDLLATCAQAAGAALPDDAGEDSFSIVPLLAGRAADFVRAPVIHHSAAGMFAIRDGDWKLIAGDGSGGRQQPKGKPFARPYQLYDLRRDPGEAQDLIEAEAEVAARLEQALEQQRAAGRSR